MDGDHADDLLRRALIDAEASASVALRVAPLALSETLTVVFHGRKDLGTIQTYVAHGGRGAGDAGRQGRAAARALRPRPGRRRGPRGGRAPVRRAGRARCATRWSAPTPCWTSGASRWRTWRTTRCASTAAMQLDLAPARAPADADRAGGARRSRSWSPPVCGARAARRGPPADGHRLRPAGLRARLSAAGRPRALPGGLPRARRRRTPARWPSSSAARRRPSSASSSSPARTSRRPAD